MTRDSNYKDQQYDELRLEKWILILKKFSSSLKLDNNMKKWMIWTQHFQCYLEKPRWWWWFRIEIGPFKEHIQSVLCHILVLFQRISIRFNRIIDKIENIVSINGFIYRNQFQNFIIAALIAGTGFIILRLILCVRWDIIVCALRLNAYQNCFSFSATLATEWTIWTIFTTMCMYTNTATVLATMYFPFATIFNISSTFWT